MLFTLIGKEIYKVDRKKLISDGSIMKACVKYVSTKNKYEEAFDGRQVNELGEVIYAGDVNNNKLKKLVASDIARNKMLVDIVINAFDSHNCIMVISDLVFHCEYLANAINATLLEKGINIPVYTLYGGSSFQMKDFDKSTKECIIVATFGKAEEGLDIPQLDALLLALPCKSSKRLEQSIGRIERASSDKGTPCIYDVFDEDNGPLRGKSKTRQAVYSERNLHMEDITKQILGGK